MPKNNVQRPGRGKNTGKKAEMPGLSTCCPFVCLEIIFTHISLISGLVPSSILGVLLQHTLWLSSQSLYYQMSLKVTVLPSDKQICT